MSPPQNLEKPLQNARLLVVDDDLLSIKLMKAVFANEDCQVKAVASAADALQAIPVFRPDILLLDLLLPAMHGLELTQILKARAETRNLVIIAVTAGNGPSAVRLALEAGCAAYLRKPIDPLAFAAQVSQVWNKARDTRPAGTNWD